MCELMPESSICSHRSVSVFVPVSQSFHSSSPVVKFEVGDGDASRSSFIVLGCLAILGFLCSNTKLKGDSPPPISVKNYAGILMQMTILMVL